MRAKQLNLQVLLESMCCAFFGAMLVYLTESGRYLSYVTPRMKPYLYFAAAVMLLWTGVGLFRVFQPRHKVRAAHCFVLAIPMLLLVLPHDILDASNLAGNYLAGNTFQGQTVQSGAPGAQIASAAPAAGNGESSRGLDSASEIGQSDRQADAVPQTEQTEPGSEALIRQETTADTPGLDEANKNIVISNDHFSMWLTKLYMEMERYEGYTVTVTGFVYNDPALFKEDEFVAARLMMSCCVADLAPAGLMCKYNNASELQQDTWVTVEGVLLIGQYEYGGQVYDDPQLQVTKITPAQTVEGYVYPY